MAKDTTTEEAPSAPPTVPPEPPVIVRKFKVKDFLAEEDLKAKLNYSPNGLSEAMAEQAGLFSYYGVLAAKASKQVDDIKILIENTEAKVDREIRTRMALLGEKVTEGIVERRITRHPQVVAFKRALNEAKQIEAVAKTTLEAFRHRKDMLVQAGATDRQERAGELSMAVKREQEQAGMSARDRVAARFGRSAAAEAAETMATP
ncbi:hypothetical protein [Methylorubrum extorquens]|uniref:hypothetical protein n=1 Tax=Methylorubrum extorquens TaxID=408 RepID=UPI0020A13DD6|nr:hypothetical protein [Methylorubrum extorquens]MCP1540011.1 hypothetical protein [Methylorubrum extorquens]